MLQHQSSKHQIGHAGTSYSILAKMLKLSRVVSLIFVLAAAAVPQSHPSSADRAAVARAKKMYYSLQRERVREVRCLVHPDWQPILASMLATGAEAKARALPYLSKVEFAARVTASGVTVTARQIDEPPPKDLPNLGKLTELVRFNVQQLLDVWRMAAFNLLLPNSSEDYRLERRDGRYRITLTSDSAVVELDGNWIIQEVRTPIPGEGVTVSMRPHYSGNPSGLLLSSIDERNVAEPSQRVRMTIDYFEKDGLELPAAFGSESQHPDGIVSMSMKLDRYEIGRL